MAHVYRYIVSKTNPLKPPKLQVKKSVFGYTAEWTTIPTVAVSDNEYDAAVGRDPVDIDGEMIIVTKQGQLIFREVVGFESGIFPIFDPELIYKFGDFVKSNRKGDPVTYMLTEIQSIEDRK
jgi:hypothetical protein